MLLIDIRSTNASAAEFMLHRLHVKLYLAGRHHHHNSRHRKKGEIRDREFLPSYTILLFIGTSHRLAAHSYSAHPQRRPVEERIRRTRTSSRIRTAA